MTAELLELASKLEAAAQKYDDDYRSGLTKLTEAAASLNESWSGSNLGYHAYVYYEGLMPRPPGAQFSPEWGLKDVDFLNMGSIGSWVEYRSADVKNQIIQSASSPDLVAAKQDSETLAVVFSRGKDDVMSILHGEAAGAEDPFLKKLLDEAESIRVLSLGEFQQALLPKGQLTSRDSNAISAGRQLAPHQEIIALAAAIQNASEATFALSNISRRAGSHLARQAVKRKKSDRVGTNVFIGHGQSKLWLELKDFVVNRLRLPYEEFNRVPVAGVTNIARLSDMLEGASCALIVLTAEDEQIDGSVRARMNVIHEVGLFQGRLGFTRAIVVLEDGCEEFSNIQGLGQVRFPKGHIAAAFEEIRLVLEREGVAD